jgi:hypothetical protein
MAAALVRARTMEQSPFGHRQRKTGIGRRLSRLHEAIAPACDQRNAAYNWTKSGIAAVSDGVDPEQPTSRSVCRNSAADLLEVALEFWAVRVPVSHSVARACEPTRARSDDSEVAWVGRSRLVGNQIRPVASLR